MDCGLMLFFFLQYITKWEAIIWKAELDKINLNILKAESNIFLKMMTHYPLVESGMLVDHRMKLFGLETKLGSAGKDLHDGKGQSYTKEDLLLP